jgi:hypothetical protein
VGSQLRVCATEMEMKSQLTCFSFERKVRTSTHGSQQGSCRSGIHLEAGERRSSSVPTSRMRQSQLSGGPRRSSRDARVAEKREEMFLHTHKLDRDSLAVQKVGS